MQLDEARRDGQSQARALGGPTRLGQAEERFEDALLLFRRNSCAIVAHFYPHLVIHLKGSQLDAATVRREFDGVAGEIQKDLLKSHTVGVNMQTGLDLLE